MRLYVHLIGHSPSGLFRTSANNDKSSKQHMAVCGLSLHQGSTEIRKTLEQKFIFQIDTLKDPFSLTVMHRGRFVVSGTQKIAITVSSFSGGEIYFHLNSLFML